MLDLFCIKCVVCKQPIENKIISLKKECEGCTITKACCQACFTETKDKWEENGWLILPKMDGC